MKKNHKWYECWDYYLAIGTYYLTKIILGLLGTLLVLGFSVFVVAIIFLMVTTFFTWILQFLSIMLGVIILAGISYGLAWLWEWAKDRKNEGC